MGSLFNDRSFEGNAVSGLQFALRSRLGRALSPRRRSPKNPFIHIGCGANLLTGFDNLDFYAMRFWAARHIGHDLRYPLPYADASFDGAFSEHTLEHLYVGDAERLLREIRRVLKPGSVARIAVPDLGRYVAFYNGAPSDPEFAQFGSGCEAIWSLTQYWGHLSCWDAVRLVAALGEAGFSGAAQATFRNGRDARLLQDTPARHWETLYVEAVA